jgi:hypothetical protein
MKKLVGALLLLVIAPIGAVIEGCSTCGSEAVPSFFDVQGLTFDAIRQGQAVAAGESVVADDVQLVVQLQARYYGLQPVFSGWLPAAYACEPSRTAGYKGSEEVLDSLVVRSTYAYDAAHPAGASLNDLLVDQSNSKTLPAKPAPNQMPYAPALRLLSKPTQAGPQQFVVRCRFTNGEVYTARTPVFTLR